MSHAANGPFDSGQRAGLAYVYIGNVMGEGDVTLCPELPEPLIRRRGFSVEENIESREREDAPYCRTSTSPAFFRRTMERYRILPHTADGKFRAFGATLEEAFANAALAVASLMWDWTKVGTEASFRIEVRGRDLEQLLYQISRRDPVSPRDEAFSSGLGRGH